MYRQQLSLDKSKNQLQINVDNDHLILDIYMLELETNGKRIVQKIIKEILNTKTVVYETSKK